jgi:mannosyltransferase OCH1-like enzyme
MMKTIYQTWKDENIAGHSDLAVECAASFKRLHPQWNYELWTDAMIEVFVREEYPWVYHYWSKFDMHLKKVDVVRYCWLHKYDGMYADLDVYCHKPMDELFDEHHDIYFYLSLQAKANNWPFAGNAWMYARVPGHPFWEDLMQFNCLYTSTGDPHKNILWHTGPKSVGHVLEYHMRKNPDHRIKIVSHEIVGNNGEGDNQYATHHRAHVWS